MANPWTVTVNDYPIPNSKRTVVQLAFSNGEASFEEFFDVTASATDAIVADFAARAIEDREVRDTAAAALKKGTITPALLPAVVPTADEVAVKEFVAAHAKFAADKKAVTAGVMKVSDQQYIDDEAAFKAAFKPGFEIYVTLQA